MYDYSKLCGKITEVCGTQARFAAKMGVSEHSISLKLNNKVDFKQTEIVRAAGILGISAADYGVYFFAVNVQSA